MLGGGSSSSATVPISRAGDTETPQRLVVPRGNSPHMRERATRAASLVGAEVAVEVVDEEAVLAGRAVPRGPRAVERVGDDREGRGEHRREFWVGPHDVDHQRRRDERGGERDAARYREGIEEQRLALGRGGLRGLGGGEDRAGLRDVADVGVEAPERQRARRRADEQRRVEVFGRVGPVWISNLQPDFNVRVIERFGPDSFAVLRERRRKQSIRPKSQPNRRI